MVGSTVGSAALAPSVAATLDVLAAEIELAGARCLYLDRVLGEVMESLPECARDRLFHGMHGVDLLAQHLTSLAGFARRVSEAAPAVLTAPVGDALAEITLGALAERMSMGLGGADRISGPPAAGEVDLF